MAASVGWDGPGQGSASLGYYIGAVPASLDRAQVETALKTALDAWAAVADLTFTRSTTAQQLDAIDFTFGPLDGAGRALAIGYLPDDVNPARVAGDIRFDSAERWEIGNDRGNAAFDLTLVAVHEIGHALGLDHLAAADSVMRSSVSPSQTYQGLGASDRTAILGLYAAADGADNPAPTPPTIPSTPSAPNPRTWPWGRRGRSGRAEAAPVAGHPLFAAASRWQNGQDASDVNGDGRVTSNDALRIVNRLNADGPRALADGDAAAGGLADFIDCNGDSQLTPLDALVVINRLNLQPLDASGAELAAQDVSGAPSREMPPSDSGDDVEGVGPEAPEGTATDTESTPSDDTSSGDTSSDDTPDDATGADPGKEVGSACDGDDDGNGTPPSETDGGVGAGDRWNRRTESDRESDVEGDDDSPTAEASRRRGDGRGDLFARFDDNGDGQLTPDEMSDRLWEHLAGADANEDGALSPEEVAAFHAQPPRRVRGDLWERFDANADARLTEEELPEALWSRLAAADTDGDLAVTAEELAALHAAEAERKGARIIARWDANGDGLLTQEEVTDRIWARLADADANEDGAVSAAELARLLPRLHPAGHHHGPIGRRR